MNWFEGLTFGSAQHVPHCRALIDRAMGDYYALNFSRAGHIEYGVDGGPRRTLPAPVAWWTEPYRHYTYWTQAEAGWDHYYVTFRGPRVAAYAAAGLWQAADPQVAAIWQAEPFTASFEALIATLTEQPVTNPRAVCWLEHLLLQLHQQVPPAVAESPVAAHARALLARLRAAPCDSFDLAVEAAAAACSVSHLRRVFGQVAGDSPHRVLLTARMDEAARLLTSTDAAIKEIAARVRCSDVYHFTRLFRRRYGVPPAAYRRSQMVTGPASAAW